jgi:hypothetical protein
LANENIFLKKEISILSRLLLCRVSVYEFQYSIKSSVHH